MYCHCLSKTDLFKVVSRSVQQTFLILIPFLFLSSGSVAQVISNSNQIQGTYEITNTNPEILEQVRFNHRRAHAVSLDHDPTLVAGTTSLIESPTRLSFELTVETDEDGVDYDVFYADLRMPTRIYGPRQQVRVFEEPAPAPEVTFQDCMALVRVHAVHQETGEPQEVTRLEANGYRIDGDEEFTRRSYHRTNNFTSVPLLLPDDGQPAEVRVSARYRAHPSLPLLVERQTFELPSPTCDQIFNFNLEIPSDDRPIPEEATLKARFDLVGEEVHQGSWQPAVGFIPLHLPGPFPISVEKTEIPAPQDNQTRFYLIHSERDFDFQTFQPTRGFYSVSPNEVTDLGETFVMDPGRLQAGVHLVAPADELSGNGESCLAGLYRDVLGRDSNQDGVPDGFGFYGSHVYVAGTPGLAPGSSQSTQYASARKAFSGFYQPESASLEGEIDFALGHLNNEDGFWGPWRPLFRFFAPGTPDSPDGFIDSTVTLNPLGLEPLIVRSGQTTRRQDIRACFSEVRVHYLSLHSTFYRPRLTAGGSFDGTDFDGLEQAYNVSLSRGFGHPYNLGDASDEGMVRVCLPQGDYQIRPLITALNPGGGVTDQTLDPLELNVGCRQVIDVQTDLQLNLDEVPHCVANPSLTLAGSESGAFDIDSLFADVNGTITETCTGGCGTETDYSIPVTLAACENKITVTARDNRDRTASASTTVHLDDTPPIFDACLDIDVQATSEDGAKVSWDVNANDTCGGARPVTCDWASGSLFPPGETLVTCKASDPCGLESSCSFTVNVQTEIEDGNSVCFVDDFESTDVTQGWNLSPVGDADAENLEIVDGELRLTGDGTSLYHEDEDHGAFAWRSATSENFRAEIKVSDMPHDNGGPYRKATLMVRAGLEAAAPRIAVSYVPHFPGGAALMFDTRLADGSAYALASTLQDLDGQGVELPVHLAVERRDGVLTVYVSKDGESWIRPAGGLGGSVSLDLGNEPFVGPMVTSYSELETVTFAFDDFNLCRPVEDNPDPGGQCSGDGLDVIYLVDQSGSMSRPLDDGVEKGEAVRVALERVTSGLAEDGNHRIAVIGAKAEAPPFDYPYIETTTHLTPTDDTAAVQDVLDSLNAGDAEDATPLTQGLQEARRILAENGSDRSPVILWATDGLSNIDSEGNGPVFYTESEIRGISLRDGGSFRGRGDVAWSGSYNPRIGTYDGEASADVMAAIEELREDFPRLRIVTLMPHSQAAPAFADLPDYAAHLTSGAVVTLLEGEQFEDAVEELLTALDCAPANDEIPLFADGFESGDCASWSEAVAFNP